MIDVPTEMPPSTSLSYLDLGVAGGFEGGGPIDDGGGGALPQAS